MNELQQIPSGKEKGNMALNFGLQLQIVFLILCDHSLTKSVTPLIK